MKKNCENEQIKTVLVAENCTTMDSVIEKYVYCFSEITIIIVIGAEVVNGYNRNNDRNNISDRRNNRRIIGSPLENRPPKKN